MAEVLDSNAEALPHVAVRGVSKLFRIPEQRVHTLKERVLHPRRKIRYQSFQALRDISFAVQPGEFFGIAGRNGSGKSTLLKCMAGIYKFDGDIWVRGRLSTFIELGVGFNMDLAARDNVIMNGLMMGLSPREARKRYDAVIEFAELQDFKDLKLKNYSSGMQVRLAFSVAIQVDAEILLIDEVLAVGDASFQQKCFDVFNRMRDEGKTIVFVTHDMYSLRRFCHRAVLLERGSMVHIGDPKDVADQYLEINFGRDPEALERGEHAGDGDARVIEVWMENDAGAAQSRCSAGPARDSARHGAVHGARRGSAVQRLRPQRGPEGGTGGIELGPARTQRLVRRRRDGDVLVLVRQRSRPGSL